MKHIAILSGISPAIKRGVPRVALNYAKGLMKRGLQVSIFCMGEREDTELIDGVRVNTFAYSPSMSSARNYAKMALACRRGWRLHYAQVEPTVVHGHDPLTYFFILPLLNKTVKKVFTVHDPLVYHQEMLGRIGTGLNAKIKRFLFKYVELSIYKRSDAVHAISTYTASRPFLDQRLEKPKIVGNWVDFDVYRPAVNRVLTRESLGIGEEFVIFTLRALESRMGLSNLIQGIAPLIREGRSVRLVIGGKGPLHAHLEKLAASLGISERVTLLGFVSDEDAVKWYQAADVVVVPSVDGEGFGLPILEAMGCGTPVLATPVCAMPEVLRGKPERLFDGVSAGDIRSGLARFIDQQQSPSDPIAERAYVLQRYSENSVLELVMADY